MILNIDVCLVKKLLYQTECHSKHMPILLTDIHFTFCDDVFSIRYLSNVFLLTSTCSRFIGKNISIMLDVFAVLAIFVLKKKKVY